jgi:hypothetical protein
MKNKTFIVVIVAFLLLSACALGLPNFLSPGNTLVPGADIDQQVATIVAGTLTQTSVQATLTPLPGPASLPVSPTSQKIYLDPIIGIQFSYPGNWYFQDSTNSQPTAIIVTSFDPANPPHKLEWSDQTVSMQFHLLPAGSAPQNLDAWVEAARQSAFAAQLTLFEEERFLIANQPAARSTLVSGSGAIIHQILTILDGRNYEINIEGNLDLGKSILSTLRVYSSGGLKPSEGDTPAAGICLEPQEEQVAIALGLDQSGMPLAGRCILLSPTQRIKLVNQSGESIAIQFADFDIDLPVGNEILLDKPIGEYLASGVHYLPMGTELWLKAVEPIVTPLATMPGPLSYYANPEAGYTLTLPPGWNVDEYGLAMPNKEVIFYSNNTEPFVTYLSISLDPRTLDQVMNSYTENVPEAAREDTVFNGLPAVKFTYPYGRHEYYIPFENRLFLIITEKPTDGNVQLMLLSISFTSTTVTRYTNYEPGYSLGHPTDWLVDENGLAALSKEVRFYPPNAEPFVSYLDIGLDPRTLDTLKAQDVPNAQKAEIFYAGTAGVQYLYSSGRSEIYLDYHGQVYYLFSDKPTDDGVQDMIGSFVFIDS